jgi:hypothetical protein
MALETDALAEHRQNSYELWERMAKPWERRRSSRGGGRGR